MAFNLDLRAFGEGGGDGIGGDVGNVDDDTGDGGTSTVSFPVVGTLLEIGVERVRIILSAMDRRVSSSL